MKSLKDKLVGIKTSLKKNKKIVDSALLLGGLTTYINGVYLKSKVGMSLGAVASGIAASLVIRDYRYRKNY